MPPGNTLARPPSKVIEKTTVEACIAIALKVQRSHLLSGDGAGSEAARQVAIFIESELLSNRKASR